MKIKTSELIGWSLDYAVAATQGCVAEIREGRYLFIDKKPYRRCDGPSINWSKGGPIIEREKIELIPERSDTALWCAAMWVDNSDLSATGPTPLIAAMRCYVASKIGEEVEIPEELCK